MGIAVIGPTGVAVFVLSTAFNDEPDFLSRDSFYGYPIHATLNRFCIVCVICIYYKHIVNRSGTQMAICLK